MQKDGSGDLVRVNDEQVEAVLAASREMLGLVARSLNEAIEIVTLPQFRVLVILRQEQPLRMGIVADRLGAPPSTISRTVDRLVALGLVERPPHTDSRREVLIQLTAQGRELVEDVWNRRRDEIRSVLARMDEDHRPPLAAAFTSFAEATSPPSVRDAALLGL